MDSVSVVVAVACAFSPSSPIATFASLLRGGGRGGDSDMFDSAQDAIMLPSKRTRAEARQSDDKGRDHDTPIFHRLVQQSLPLMPIPWKSIFAITVALYALNQSHALPRPLSRIVSRVLFWPTLPITAVKRFGHWMTDMDDTVTMGGAPFGFLGFPRELYTNHDIRGVVNLCDEYSGPARHYHKYGMVEWRLPTVDHFEPSVQSLQSAVAFLQDHAQRGERVYVHCRAGHGRSAAVVMAWTMATTAARATREASSSSSSSPSSSLCSSDVDFMKRINEQLSRKRNIRKTLWKQPNLRQFHQLLLEKMRDDASDNVAVADETQQELLEQQRNDTVASVAASSVSKSINNHAS